jgi:5'-nucleotidase (lipoprotein e(P4) family)
MRTVSLVFVVAIAMVGCHRSRPLTEAPPPAAPVNVTAELAQMGADAVLWQNTSAEAYWSYQQAYAYASQRLFEILRFEDLTGEPPEDPRPTAVIVDIDETVLDNSPYQVNAVREGRTFDPAAWKTWTDKAVAKASPGALEFLAYAKERGCEVFYITNRTLEEKASTLKNLNDLGFPFADEAHLLLMEGTSDKTARRAKVYASHRVILLVGDQLRDFDERFKDRSVDHGRNVVDQLADSLSQFFILLPNPMYGTYRDAVQGKGTEEEKLGNMKAFFDHNGY